VANAIPAGPIDGVQWTTGEAMPGCSDFVIPGCRPFETIGQP
jgi:hypothetical protein